MVKPHEVTFLIGGFLMKKKRILIVDDYLIELELMKEILDYEGYETVTASFATEA